MLGDSGALPTSRDGNLQIAAIHHRAEEEVAIGNVVDAIGQNASLGRAAMAEHAGYLSDRENLSRQIAQAANPEVRRALEVRKDIEKADYVALTSDRIARQSYVITGNKGPNSEFDKFTKQAEYNRQHATELRQQWRELTQPEPKRSQTANTQTAQDAPEPAKTGPNRYAELKDQAAELQKNQQQQQNPPRPRGPRM